MCLLGRLPGGKHSQLVGSIGEVAGLTKRARAKGLSTLDGGVEVEDGACIAAQLEVWKRVTVERSDTKASVQE